MTKIVVTGASGFIGTRLVHKEIGKGTRVIALDILPPRERLIGAQYVTHDVTSPIDPKILEGAEVIYNLAAVHRTPGHPPEEYYRTNVLGALNVTRSAEGAGVDTILFTSSISVYGPQETIVAEHTPLAPVSDYGRSKQMAEIIHRQWVERDPARKLVVVRPGVVFGPGERGNYTFLARALRKRMFLYPGRRDAIKSGGYVDELVETLAFALRQPYAEITYNFAFPALSTTQDIVNAFHRTAGFPPPLGVAPLPLMLAAAAGFEALGALGVRTPIHRDRVRKLANSTGVAPRWLVENGYDFRWNLISALEAWRDETDGEFI